MKIKIDTNEKYTIKLETVKEDFKESFFSGVYKSALDNLIEIVDASINRKDNKNNGFISIVPEEKNKDNNIIAFVGERGSGKSSTMLSFVNAIGNMNELLNFGSHPNHEIKNYHFEFIDVIDPSLFERNDNILEIVIARMFHKFRESFSSDNNSANKDYNAKKNLLEKFEKVYKSIKTIEKNEKYSSEDELIEEISNLSTGSNLRKNIQCLVDEYLSFFNEEKHKFLVLVIDDFDLNIKHASEMAELIRKYLFIPNVIIFTALNFNDLSLLMQQDYSKSLETSLKNNQITNEEIKDKSFRYLEKFIPYPRRVFLPDIKKDRKEVSLYFDENLEELLFNSYLNTNKKIKKEEYKERDIESKISDLINLKTTLKVDIGVGYYDTLIPDNLRELRSLIFMLLNLKDIEIKSKKQIRTNIFIFENYINEIWVKKNLSYNYQNYIKILNNIDTSDKNSFTIQYLIEIFSLEKKISINNLFILLRKVPINNQTVSLLFSIRINYSILFNKLLLESNYRDIISIIFNDKLKNLPPNHKLTLNTNNIIHKIKHFFEINITFKNNLKIDLNKFFSEELFKYFRKLVDIYLDRIFDTKYSDFYKQVLSENLYESLLKDFTEYKNNNKELEDILYKFLNRSTFPSMDQYLIKLNNLSNFYKNKSELSNSLYIKHLIEIYSDIENEEVKFDEVNKRNFINSEIYLFKENIEHQEELISIRNKYINVYFDEYKAYEFLEIFFIWFRFITKDENIYSLSKTKENTFSLLLSSLLEKNDVNFYFGNKSFYVLELLNFEYYTYIQNYLEKDIEIILEINKEKINWNSNNNSISYKINDYMNKGYNTAVPIYNINLLEEIVRNLDNFKLNNKYKFYDLITFFFSNLNSNLIDLENKSYLNSFQENPLIKPFIGINEEYRYFRDVFSFIFDIHN